MLSLITPQTSILRLGQKSTFDNLNSFVLPKDTPIYHGSSNKDLANSDPPLPVGRDRYNPSSFSKNVDISYYSSVDVARFYAGKVGNIFAFRTLRRLILLQLTVENLEILWPRMPLAVQETITKIYLWTPGKSYLTRPKGTVTDASWVVWMKTNLNPLFDGIFVDRLWREEKGKGVENLSLLHASQDEVILFDATNSLVRATFDSNDWQYSFFIHLPVPLQELKTEMQKYMTTNKNFHAGDLWEHSVWSCLWAERICDILNIHCPDVDNKTLSALALIHDIGKCNPDACSKEMNKYTYYAQPNHPKFGADLIRKNSTYLGVNIPQLMKYLFGHSSMTLEDIAFVVESHWDLGPALSAWFKNHRRHSDILAYAEKHAGKKELTVKYLFLVSVADILAAQPPTVTALLQNVTSRYWPIVNVPRKYKGDFVMQNRVGITDMSDIKAFFFQLFPSTDHMEIM
jgi:hypothetical protein